MHHFLAGTFLLMFAWAANAQLPASGPLPETKGSGIGYRTVQEALTALKAKRGVKVSQQGGWTIVEDQESDKVMALWSFAPEGYPAYPAAVKRAVVEKDGAVYIDMKVLCQAAKEPCDALVRDFQALTDRMKASMQHSAH